MPIRHLRVLVLMLMLPTSLHTTVAAQDSNSAIQNDALQACGGIESFRLKLRLTLARFPDKLGELEGELDDAIAETSESSAFSELSLTSRDLASVLGQLGNKRRCNYISRCQSCVAEGYERLTNTIPFFSYKNIDELTNRNLAVVATSQTFSEIQYRYIFDSNPPQSLQFSGVNAADKIYLNFRDYTLSDALLVQYMFNEFYCTLLSQSDEDIINSENRS